MGNYSAALFAIILAFILLYVVSLMTTKEHLNVDNSLENKQKAKLLDVTLSQDEYDSLLENHELLLENRSFEFGDSLYIKLVDDVYSEDPFHKPFIYLPIDTFSKVNYVDFNLDGQHVQMLVKVNESDS